MVQYLVNERAFDMQISRAGRPIRASRWALFLRFPRVQGLERVDEAMGNNGPCGASFEAGHAQGSQAGPYLLPPCRGIYSIVQSTEYSLYSSRSPRGSFGNQVCVTRYSGLARKTSRRRDSFPLGIAERKERKRKEAIERVQTDLVTVPVMQQRLQ